MPDTDEEVQRDQERWSREDRAWRASNTDKTIIDQNIPYRPSRGHEDETSFCYSDIFDYYDSVRYITEEYAQERIEEKIKREEAYILSQTRDLHRDWREPHQYTIESVLTPEKRKELRKSIENLAIEEIEFRIRKDKREQADMVAIRKKYKYDMGTYAALGQYNGDHLATGNRAEVEIAMKYGVAKYRSSEMKKISEGGV